MFRLALQRSPVSVRAGLGQPIPTGAWNGAWRRLFNSPSEKGLPNQALAQSTRLLQALRGTTRYGTSRATFRAPQDAVGRASQRGFRFSAWRRNNGGAGKEQPLSLGDRLKKLSREYGWSAVGVYLGLSVLDFPFCFLLVRIVGADNIGKLEHWVVSNVSTMIPDSIRQKWRDYWQSAKNAEAEHLSEGEITDKVEMVGWGVEEAQVRNKEEASLATQLALAYAIHKTFIFIRVPLTAAITPKVVKVLRSWGWNIGKRKPRPT